MPPSSRPLAPTRRSWQTGRARLAALVGLIGGSIFRAGDRRTACGRAGRVIWWGGGVSRSPKRAWERVKWELPIIAAALLAVAGVSRRLTDTSFTPAMVFVLIGLLL